MPLKKCSDGDFDAVDAALQLEDFDLVREGLLVGFQHADDVFAVFFFADEEAPLDVLRFPAGLDDVAVGIFLHEFDRRIEGVEILVWNNVDAGLLQLFLAEGTVVFEAVGVFGAADDRLPCRAQGLSPSALPEGVVENDDVGPLLASFSQSVDLGTKPSAMSRSFSLSM